jgi:uncharacterized membrane protein YedE/YeeE
VTVSPEFSPIPALLGGAILGGAASVLLLTSGRVAGISGVVGGLLSPVRGDVAWRGAFTLGLLVAGGGALVLAPDAFASDLERPPVALALAGVLVGYGTRLGNGCTSGHGVCGLSRLSPRSLASVVTFMLTGGIAAAIGARLFGGS